jgi:putative sterol carrier protein
MNATHVLATAAQAFVAIYHADDRLCADQADWDCVVRLQATDATEQVSLDIRLGRVHDVTTADATAQLVVTARLSILLDVLHLRLNPSEPYIFGELVVAGDEADFMRVDYIASTLCASA